MSRLRTPLLSSLWLAVTTPIGAQQPTAAAPPAPATPIPAVGEMAPDFAIRGATRYGLLREPARLADLRGQTVVLAFFVRARTRG